MRTYNPDKWVILDLKDNNYKVLAGWSGGYLDGDSWRISSGIASITRDKDYYLVTNHSGSVYKCHYKAEGFNGITAQIYDKVKDKATTIEVEKCAKELKESDNE